jgi:hypothetical protein
MVPVTALWLPILVAAVLVFVVSSIIHTVLGYHNSDFGGVPNEDAVRDVLRPVPAGDYVVPHPADPKERQSEGFKAKVEQGPVAFLTVFGKAGFDMKTSLLQWFVYCILTGTVAAYATGVAYGPGTDYLVIFRMAGTVAFAAYGWALLQASIWFNRKWSTTLKSLFDALVYGCVTAGTLGWLWPS